MLGRSPGDQAWSICFATVNSDFQKMYCQCCLPLSFGKLVDEQGMLSTEVELFGGLLHTIE